MPERLLRLGPVRGRQLERQVRGQLWGQLWGQPRGWLLEVGRLLVLLLLGLPLMELLLLLLLLLLLMQVLHLWRAEEGGLQNRRRGQR